jgi:hypothetical protein
MTAQPGQPFDAEAQGSYNETYSTLKIESYGVVVTLEDLACDAECLGLPSPFDRTAWLDSRPDTVREEDLKRDSRTPFPRSSSNP